jgi:putative solute:sodium symporter small subunit
MSEERNRAYWRANISLMLVLLAIWFSVSFLAGIIFVDFLDQFRLFGYKLGFWFSQQGSIYFFVALIFFYAWRMNALDKKFGVEEKD